jgi:hypothetical protein
MVFFEAAVLFSNMDVLSGEDLYEKTLVLTETEPLNDRFDFLGMGSRNFVQNSGSFLVLSALLPLVFHAKRALHWVCLRLARFSLFRWIGVRLQAPREEPGALRR